MKGKAELCRLEKTNVRKANGAVINGDIYFYEHIVLCEVILWQ